MRTASLVFLALLVGAACSAPPPAAPDPPSRMSIRGLSLTLASVKDAVNHRVPQAVLSIVDSETEADGLAMGETLMTIADGSPEFLEALMTSSVDDLAADGDLHTWRYAEDDAGDDAGYSMVVLIDFRLSADGTAYLHSVRAAG